MQILIIIDLVLWNTAATTGLQTHQDETLSNLDFINFDWTDVKWRL